MSLEGFAALKLMQLFELRNDEVLQTGRTNLVHQKSVGRQGIQRLLKIAAASMLEIRRVSS